MSLRKVELVLTAAGLVLLAPGVFLTISDLLPLPPQIDFAAYFLAAQALRGGEDPYDPAVLERLARLAGITAHTPYIYPPLLAVVIRPLAAIPYDVAAAVWLAMSAAALVGALVLLRRVAPVSDRVFPFIAAAAFFLPPVHHTLELGQINHFLLLLIVAAAIAGRGVVSGVLLGIAGALKVFPAVLGGVFLIRRDLRGIVGLALTGIIITAASVNYASGQRSMTDWYRNVAPKITGTRLVTPNNQSLEAVSARLFTPHTFEAMPLGLSRSTKVDLEPLVHMPGAARAAFLGIAALAVALTVLTLISTRHVPGSTARFARFAVVLSLTLMVLPVVWDHYYVLLLLPLAVLFREADRRSIRYCLFLSGFLILFHRYWRLTLYLGSPLLLSTGLAGVIVIWIALLGQLRRLTRASVPGQTAYLGDTISLI